MILLYTTNKLKHDMLFHQLENYLWNPFSFQNLKRKAILTGLVHFRCVRCLWCCVLWAVDGYLWTQPPQIFTMIHLFHLYFGSWFSATTKMLSQNSPLLFRESNRDTVEKVKIKLCLEFGRLFCSCQDSLPVMLIRSRLDT